MTRFVLPLLLSVLACVLVCAPAGADDPPKKLSAEERKELEKKWKELHFAGERAYRTGKATEATKAYEEGLKVTRSLYPKTEYPDGHPDLATALNNLGILYAYPGKYADAELMFEEALAMRRRLHKGDHPHVGGTLDNLGAVYLLQYKLADAELMFEEALAMRRRLHKGDHPDVARSLNSLATLYTAQGKRADAEPLCRESLEMHRRLFKGDHPGTVNALNGLASTYVAQAKIAAAEPLMREALEMQRRLNRGDHPSTVTTLISLGNLLREQNKSDAAERSYREALEMHKRLFKGDEPILAAILSSLASLDQSQGKYAAAEPLYKEALEMHRRLFKGDHPYVAAGLHSLAGLYHAQGEHAAAEPLFTGALAMDRRLTVASARDKTEGETLTFVSQRSLTIDGYLSSSRESGAVPAGVYAQVWPAKGYVARVYERRQLRARAAAADPKAGKVLAELTDARRRRAELLLAPAARVTTTRDKRDEDIKTYEGRIERLTRELKELLPLLERSDKLDNVDPTELQKALPAEVAVVDFLRFMHFEQDKDKPGKAGEKRTPRYLAFVVTRDKVAWVDLDPAAVIEPAIDAWRDAITGGKEIPPAIPAKVRELVWDKVRKELPANIKTVYVCPDQALCKVPFAALPGDKPGTVLLEDFALATIPHAPFLLDKLWPQDKPTSTPSGALVVGGVKYDAEIAAVAAGTTRGDPLVKPDAKLAWAALPGTVGELNGVTATAERKKIPATRVEGERATPAAVLSALPKARYAHFATHGFFADASFRGIFQLDPKDYEMRGGERIGRAVNSPLVMTGLVFAGANNPKAPGRGIVTGEQLIDLDLSGLELAVLSACETGLGDVAGGEGAFGLQRAFHYAGTKNVVCSLWKVPDTPTAALMSLFYTNLWDKNLAPMEALRQAQLELYKNPQKIPELAKGFRGKFEEVQGTVEVKPTADGKAHPLLWAAFTLSGPGR